jgi:hypothetical protein
MNANKRELNPWLSLSYIPSNYIRSVNISFFVIY